MRHVVPGIAVALAVCAMVLAVGLRPHVRREPRPWLGLSLEKVGCAYLRDYYAANGGSLGACHLSTRTSLGPGLAVATFDLQLGQSRFPARLRFVDGTWQVTFAMPVGAP